MIPYFFAMDRLNYSRWLPVYIMDMRKILCVLSEETEKQWTAAYLSQSPAAHSACQLPSHDLETMSASLSAQPMENGWEKADDGSLKPLLMTGMLRHRN